MRGERGVDWEAGGGQSRGQGQRTPGGGGSATDSEPLTYRTPDLGLQRDVPRSPGFAPTFPSAQKALSFDPSSPASPRIQGSAQTFPLGGASLAASCPGPACHSLGHWHLSPSTRHSDILHFHV